MPIRQKTISALNHFLWALVGALIGMLIGTTNDLDPRKIFFLIVAGAGVVTLIRLNVQRVHVTTSKEVSLLPSGEKLLLEKKDPVQLAKPAKESVLSQPQKKEEIEQKMSKEEAREWLDNLLVDLQKNKPHK